MAIEMVAKTIRIPKYLADQVEQLAGVSRRSFTKQVEIMLENSIDGTVESDLRLLKTMGAKFETSES